MSDTDTGTPIKTKAPVAQKYFIDANGNEVEIELGTGIYYKSLASGTDTKYQIPGAKAGSIQTMLALFGATTLATNTASFNRNAAKDEAQFADDTQAVSDRFSRIEEDPLPTWGTKTGGGFQIDLDVLFDAVTEAAGKEPDERDSWKTKITDNAVVRRQLRNHTKVAPIYEKLLRERRPVREEKSLDDLLKI